MSEKILIGEKVPEKCKSTLIGLGYELFVLPPFERLFPAVTAYHPDTLIFRLSDRRFLLQKEYFEQIGHIIKQAKMSCAVTDEEMSCKYPGDILLNALSVSGTVFGLKSAASDIIKADAKRFINVKQGYAACSVSMLSDKAAVTSDIGLARALEKENIDVLLIHPGHILLDGHEYGFIGGASGRLPDGRTAFFGKIKAHPDGELIYEFAAEHRVELVELSDEPLTDVGGLIAL